ncbi:hypothetical protein DFH07DRAFT_783650 [Mycena maculata]|uniref:Uncharacterized protein n=1 Tax=Mycena maculata TaxID=230809 RepID=A0AAD7HL14_9AGAR|nr:hypothetical protein DFH07DRAFT_783650 [Mycena maculata]
MFCISLYVFLVSRVAERGRGANGTFRCVGWTPAVSRIYATDAADRNAWEPNDVKIAPDPDGGSAHRLKTNFDSQTSVSFYYCPSRMPDSITKHLPVEISTYIFALAIFGGVASFWEMAQTRWAIFVACGSWLKILNREARFWTWIMISPKVGVDCLRDSICRSGSRALNIHISFRELDIQAYIARNIDLFSTTNDLAITLLSRRLSYALTHCARWCSLKMETDMRTVVQTLRPAFKRLHAPQLRCISMTYLHPSDTSNFAIQSSLTQHTWFSLELPCLEILSLHAVSMRWADLPTLPCLRSLSVFSVESRFSPTFIQYKEIIESSTILEHLALREVGCADIHLIPKGSHITSSSIRSLHIRFGDRPDLRRLASKFVFPALENVAIEISSSSDIICTVLCRDLFASVRKLAIVGVLVLPHTLVFSVFSCITYLDLTQAGSMVFAQLVESSTERRTGGLTTVMPGPWPGLNTIVLGHEAPRIIRKFVVLHGAREGSSGKHMTLRCVRTTFLPLASPLTPADLLDLSWITAHIIHFSIEKVAQSSLSLQDLKWRVFPNSD